MGTQDQEVSQDEDAYLQAMSDIFEDLLSKADYVPGLAIKFCC